MYKNITILQTTQVLRITLNRPGVLNALNRATHEELNSAFNAYACSDTLRVCVLAGAGPRAFCAGSDLKEAAQEQRYSGRSYGIGGYGGLVQRFDLDKPVIAEVNGLCLGGGFELALACDLIIASTAASFGLPEPKVGAIAASGGLHRLPRQIGLKRAMGIILSAEIVSAEEGFRLGFVNEVASPEQLSRVTERWCESILRCAPISVEASKHVVMRGMNEARLADALSGQSSYSRYAQWAAAEDTREGTNAFAEKRLPRWQNK